MIEHSVAEQGRRYGIAMIAACPFPYPRGTPIRAFRMAEALALRGHELHVVTYHAGEETSSTPFHIHRIPRIPTYREFAPGPSYQKLLVLDPLLRRALNGVLCERTIDVIHAHHYEGLLIALSIPPARRPPVVYDAHTLLESELPSYDGLALTLRMKRSIGQLLDRTLPRRAAHVISVTELLRDRLIEMQAIDADRISVVENGVEPSLFDVPALARADGTRTVVFAGNLVPYQGIDLLLEAFRSVASQRDNVRLELATNSSFDEYAELVRRLGIGDRIKVVNVGFDQLPTWLGAADVAVNPRVVCDGVPQKLMNYMACGCPIVSFAGSAAHLRHGTTGWIIPGADPAAMADGILRLLDDRELARRIGAAAREQVRAEYSWSRSAQRAEAVYGRVLAGSRHATTRLSTHSRQLLEP
jgi:glycosyltransferase involved in cell wall biosynthesis